MPMAAMAQTVKNSETTLSCVSACNFDPLSGVIGVQN
jgi:hypothetical protein